jgi:hypothetical protein
MPEFNEYSGFFINFNPKLKNKYINKWKTE